MKSKSACLACAVALCLLPCTVHAAVSIATGSMSNLAYSGSNITAAPWPGGPEWAEWAPSQSIAMAAMAFPDVDDFDFDGAGVQEATSANASVALASASASTTAGAWGINTNVTSTASGLNASVAIAEAWQDIAIEVVDAPQTITVQADYSLSYDLTSSLNQDAYAYTEANLLLWSTLDNEEPLAGTGDFLENWIFDNDSAMDSISGTLSFELELDPGVYVLDMWLYATESEATSVVPAPGALVLCLLGGALTTRMRKRLNPGRAQSN